MKKIVAIMLALVLALSMSAVAFAEGEITANGGSADSDVKVIVKNGTLPENPEDVDPDDTDNVVYKIDIDATGAVFTYTFDSDYNTTTHQYEGGKWDKDDDVITVTNHSNTSINVSAAWKTNDGVEIAGLAATKNNVTATLSNVSFNLASAVNSGSNPPSNNIGVAVANIPTVFEGDFVLDQVTITITGLDASAD